MRKKTITYKPYIVEFVIIKSGFLLLMTWKFYLYAIVLLEELNHRNVRHNV